MSESNTTPDQGDERRAIHEWLMREHKIEVLGNPEDDTAAVISLGTLRNIARVAMSAAQPVAQPVVDQEPASMSDNGSCGSQVSGKPVEPVADEREALNTASMALENIARNAGVHGGMLEHHLNIRCYADAHARDARAALASQPEPTSKGDDDVAYRYACTLAQAIFDSEYASDPDYASGRVKWGLCDTTAGVLTQIDNMVSGMTRKSSSQQREPQEAAEVTDEAVWNAMKYVYGHSNPHDAPQMLLSAMEVRQVLRMFQVPEPLPQRNVLRYLVDVVWNEATESTAVPDTPWADRMIDKALGINIEDEDKEGF